MKTRPGLRTMVAVGVLVAGIAIAGCGSGSRQRLEVGEHRISVVTPIGWRHLDHGRINLFVMLNAQIWLADLGPMSRAGVVGEIERARALALEGRGKDAADKLRQLQAPDELFDDIAQRQAFWQVVSETREAALVDTFTARAAFDRLSSEAAGLAEREVEDCMSQKTWGFFDPERRAIASQRHLAVGGRDGLWVETWERLSHRDRRPLVMVLDHGRLLMIRLEPGTVGGSQGAFEQLVRTLEFDQAPSVESGGTPDSGAAVSGS